MKIQKKPKKNKIEYRLFIQVRNKDLPITINELGYKSIPVKWIEVPESNSGSIKNPNKEIFSVKFEPIITEKDESSKSNPFGNFFDGFLK